jgi:RNA polymerase sigma-70 factor (ECF subfamily)
MQRETFERVLRDHKDRVYSHALYCLRDADDAADVTQETFLRLWRRSPSLDDGRVGAWLLRVTHNLCIDHSRRAAVVRQRLGRPDTDALDAVPHPGVRPDAIADRRDDVLAALDILPAETRSVMLMHYCQGLKLQEIADLLGRNVNSLKVCIHRARKALRPVLDAGDGGDHATTRSPSAREENA